MGTVVAVGNQLGLNAVSGTIEDYLFGDTVSTAAFAGEDVANMNDTVGHIFPILPLADYIRLRGPRNYICLMPGSQLPFDGFL